MSKSHGTVREEDVLEALETKRNIQQEIFDGIAHRNGMA